MNPGAVVGGTVATPEGLRRANVLIRTISTKATVRKTISRF